MKSEFSTPGSLAGVLLLAHPKNRGPIFRKSVVLISAHSQENGSIGVVVNKPLDISLGQFSNSFEGSPVANIPLFDGGPVSRDQVILAAWQWLQNYKVFKLHFGVSQERLERLLEEDPSVEARAFIGYAGWESGQLENELDQQAWLVTNVSTLSDVSIPDSKLWERAIATVQPELLFFSDFPSDPHLN